MNAISIHALREEGDLGFANQFHQVGISIHALRGEGDNQRSEANSINHTFQSTPSVGRATLEQLGITSTVTDISIHALRGEGDALILRITGKTVLFQSTPSVGRAT